ncbi:MAG: D-sedoheptulose 7-phosphate isomerase [Candidatus Micrarchaeaceae archaeon]
MQDEIRKYIEEGVAARSAIRESEIEGAAAVIVNALKSGHKLITFGNGGSAADAQHIAAELAGRFYKDRKPLPAIALTTNTSSLTAIANDYSYEDVFARQMEGIGANGDVAIAISTSGNSKNVIKAVEKAKEMGIYVIGLTGGNGGALKELCDMPIVVNSGNTPIIQEVHIAIGHMICMLVEKMMFP